jgi:hypothetical protein
MGFLNWLFGKEEPKSFDIDFELFKSFGKDRYEEIKAEDGK